MRCSVCGQVAEDDVARLTWTMSRERREAEPSWTCPGCSREHARAMEAKLDEAWW